MHVRILAEAARQWARRRICYGRAATCEAVWVTHCNRCRRHCWFCSGDTPAEMTQDVINVSADQPNHILPLGRPCL